MVSQLDFDPKADRPSRRKGIKGKRVAMVRDVVREIAGFAPYERKAMALLRDGIGSKDKKARKMIRKRLGTMRRMKIKVTELEDIIQKQKKEA